jgi:hypothetical protein
MSTILLTLQNFGIASPVFVRKLNKRSDWEPDVIAEQRPQRVAELAFRESHRIFSLYYITTEQAFYSTIVGLNAPRSPQNNDTDFIWITSDELEAAGIQPKLVVEGDCLQSSILHYDACIPVEAAIRLCQNLIAGGRQAHRCQRKKTQAILEQRREIGCYALLVDSQYCACQDRTEDGMQS